MKYRIILIALFLLFLFAQPLFSHPHGWIETKADFIVKDNKITAVQAKWSFDEFTSMFLVETTGADWDKRLTTVELAKIEEQVLEIIKILNYFSHIYIDGKQYPVQKIEFAHADRVNDVINFNFVIPLPAPVNPARQGFAVSFYDPGYYYDVYVAEEYPVKFISDKSGVFSYKIEEDLKNTYYYNMVNPQVIKVFSK